MSNATATPPSQGLVIKSDPRSLQFKSLFESQKFQSSLSQALPRHLDPKRLIRVTLSAMTQNPDILECTPESVLLSLMRAASMGLEPDGGPLGQGYLVPYYNGKAKRKECQFIPGYRGLVKLARNSGEVVDVYAEVVYEKDQFDYELGLDQTLKHKRNDEAADPGALKYAYAVARFRDGEKKFVVLNRREIDKAKGVSKSGDSDYSPWKQWPAEMWKKTAVRRLCKLLPLSVEVQVAVAHGDGDEVQGLSSVVVPEMPALDMPEVDGAETIADVSTPDFDSETTHTRFASCNTEEQISKLVKELTDLHSDKDVEISALADQRREVIQRRNK